jgi:hypothetical protein
MTGGTESYSGMANRHATFWLLVAATIAVGCSSSPSPSTFRAPTPEESQQWEREGTNADRATELLESGKVHAGQSLDDFLKLCTPYRVDFIDRYAFIEFSSVPNLTGLSLVAADGKLASATEWGCVMSHEYFNSLSEVEKQAASAAYRVRLYGGRR